MTFKTTLAVAATMAVVGGAASAASITVETFTPAAYAAYTGSANILGSEDFEGFAAEVEGAVSTSVGDFMSLGPTGTGSSVVGTVTEVAVLDGSVVSGFGRVNTTQTAGAKNWLDSNDTLGIRWDATLASGESFRQVAFSLSDAADQGAELSISTGGSTLETFVGQGNGTVDWIVITFGSDVTSATIELANMVRLDDGFGIDDATIAAVPLPAGLLLLGTALGGLGVARRRRKSA